MRYLLGSNSGNQCATNESAGDFLPWEEQKILVTGRRWVCAQRRSARPGPEQGSTPTSVPGPPSWENSEAKHREVPTIPLDPPGNEPDVTQNGKGRQCASARLARRAARGNISRSDRICAAKERRNTTTRLRTD